MFKQISRRRFLRGIGVSAAAVPFLHGLDSLYEKANAQSIPKKRFIMMYTPNGQLYANWRLPQAGADLDISDGTLLSGSSLLLNPLQANAKKLLILDRLSSIGARQIYQNANSAGGDGIDHPGGHQKGLGNLLTGQTLLGGADNFGNAGLGGGISIDQVLAKKFDKTAGSKFPTPFPSLQIGVQVNEDLTDRYVDKRVSYSGPSMPLTPITNPFVLFRNVFGNVAGAAGGMSGAASAQRADIDKSVLDNALGDFTRLQPKLSSADLTLLQLHAQSVRDIETQLTTTIKTSVDCTAITAPATPTGVDITNDTATHTWAMQLANYPTVGTMMINIMVQAVACGLTNVVTFMWANSENDMTFPWLNIAKGHHGMSHARDPDLVHVDQWYATQFNTMINSLAAIPESGATGSILDNSLLMWTSCLSDGASHHSDNMPITLAGSNGGYFKQGHALRFNNVFTADAVSDQQQPPAGVPDLSNSDLMVSILNSFEVATDAGKPLSTTFGRAAFCHGALPNVTA
jgi:Protein of unknown function (DUF1552)